MEKKRAESENHERTGPEEHPVSGCPARRLAIGREVSRPVMIDRFRRNCEHRGRSQSGEDRNHEKDGALREQRSRLRRQGAQWRCCRRDRKPSCGRAAAPACLSRRGRGSGPKRREQKHRPRPPARSRRTPSARSVGATKIMIAETVIAAIARTMTPRLARVTSIAAPIGVWREIPSNPLAVVRRPTSVWVQCRPVTRNTLTNGPNRLRTSAARKLTASSAYGIGIIATRRGTAQSRAPLSNALVQCSFPEGNDPIPARALDNALRPAR